MVNMNSLFILTGVIDFKNTVNWLSGYNFNGWLKKTGELVKDACHQRQHTPIYRKIPVLLFETSFPESCCKRWKLSGVIFTAGFGVILTAGLGVIFTT